jgi:hypothetical protein
MQYQIITKMVEEYLIAFPIKMKEVDKVIGRWTNLHQNQLSYRSIENELYCY